MRRVGWRRGGRRAVGASTTVLGAAVLSAGGWLGGHLAYARCRRRHHGIPGAPGGLGAHRSGAAAGHGRPELVGVHGIAVLVLRLGDDLVAGGPLYLPG
jgi:hypothetical protein